MNNVNCACVIHGDKYDWQYVEKLYAMLRRNLSQDFLFHVFTEKSRDVPEHMIKHELIDWPGVSGPKKSWWYKMQMFDPTRISGQILYLDLDVVIVDNLDWILGLDREHLWTVRDWKHLWRPEWHGINSSVLYWNTERFGYIWTEFQNQNPSEVMKKYRGDQDFISAILSEKTRNFFADTDILSWRWQVKDGGLNMRSRAYKYPDSGSLIPPGAKILVFHGDPKPHEIQDPVIKQIWQ